MSRHFFRIFINNDIEQVRAALLKVEPSKRLHVIAEALMDINPTGDNKILQSSCGCYDWDISMDYRPHHERYPKEDPK